MSYAFGRSWQRAGEGVQGPSTAHLPHRRGGVIFGLPHLVIPRLLPTGAVYTPFASFGASALIYDGSVLYAPQAHYTARTLRPPYDAGSYEHRGRPAVVPTIPYEEGRNGFVVPPADPGALADRIEWCLHHPRELVEMRRHAAMSARSFTWVEFRAALRTGLARHLGDAALAADTTGGMTPVPAPRCEGAARGVGGPACGS